MKRNADQSLRKHEREMAQKQSGEKEQGKEHKGKVEKAASY